MPAALAGILIAQTLAAQPAAVPPPHPVISEVLYAVPAGDAGDANRDGVRSSTGDEFIEIINPHPVAIELRGYRLTDRNPAGRGQLDFTFPAVTLPPGGVAVVFNGHEAQWPGPVGTSAAAARPDPAFGDALVFTAGVTASNVSLANSGDWVLLSAPDGRPIHCVWWGAVEEARPAAIVVDEAPRIAGRSVAKRDAADPFGAHGEDGRGEGLYSPGRSFGATAGGNHGGRILASPGAPPMEAAATAPAITPTITPLVAHPDPLITELLIAVPPRGDADQDGRPDPIADAFVELINPHAAPIDLAGYTLIGQTGSGERLRVEFPAVELAPGATTVVFHGPCPHLVPSAAGGTMASAGPLAAFAGAIVFDASSAGAQPALDAQRGWLALVAPEERVSQCVWWGRSMPTMPRAAVTERVTIVRGVSLQRATPASSLIPHPRLDALVFSPGRFVSYPDLAD